MTGTPGNDVFLASSGQETFDGAAGTDTVSYASSAMGVYANLATGQVTPLPRVMPLGDSITVGVVSSTDKNSGGYRTKLWDLLRADDLAVDFVGSRVGGPSTLPDRDHEGHSGKTIDYIDANDTTFLAAQPDVILLMIGTNDLGRNTAAQMIAELRALIISITNQAPNAMLLVASIPPTHNTSHQATVRAYNDAMPGLIAELSATRNVGFVDMRDLTLADVSTPPEDSGVHPNDSGYTKIADHWYDALQATGLYEDERDSLTSIENLVGTNRRDWLVGDSGANQLSGLGGDDDLSGGEGSDTLDGGSGADLLSGGLGNDVYLIDSLSDRVIETAGGGTDTVRTTMSYTLARGTNIENLVGLGTAPLTLVGNELANRIEGGDGNDTIDGGRNNDTLMGGRGSDTFVIGASAGVDVIAGGEGVDGVLVTATNAKVYWTGLSGVEVLTATAAGVRLLGSAAAEAIRHADLAWSGLALVDGGAGNDTLIGGAAADRLAGGGGGDSLAGQGGPDDFVYLRTSDSRGAGVDTIAGFAPGADRIDLAAIDADSLAAGNQAFHLIGTAAFSRVAGELRYDTSLAGQTRLFADTNGDGRADMEIRLEGTHALTTDSLVL